MFKFNERSEQLLNTVDKRLGILAREVIKVSKVDFAITYGLRSEEEQKQLVAQGKSWNLKSKHLEGKAIDIYPCINEKIDFSADKDLFYLIGLFDCKAKELNINIRLGAFWDNPSIQQNKSLDGYHIELSE